jgi:mono/diheme cytochrome c family protein
MIKWIVQIVIVTACAVGGIQYNADNIVVEEDTSVSNLLLRLGDTTLISKTPDYTIKGVSAERGEEIVIKGFTKKPKGGTSGKQSSHFVCISCHNIQQEDPDLTVNDPLARLLYTDKNEIPFLQATTLYGAVNRATYYNGDYEKKYGELVHPARKNIRNAIQLCATECAQGRLLENWELESILAYLWKIDFKIGDLNLSEAEKTQISEAESEDAKESAISLINSRYLLKSEATFVYPPEDRKVGYNYEGNSENGKLIYENSCLHCHYQQRYSFFHLDKSKMSTGHLAAKAGSYSRQSIYQVIRWGVPSKSGKPSYMPQYTKEKLTDEMVEDLRAYLEQ